jgi:hypothetical protein
MRKIVARESDLIDRMITRDTFKVNNVTKLLSPLVLNYNLRIQIDDLRKSDILAVLHFMQTNKRRAKVVSLVIDCQSWSDSLRRFLDIGASAEIPLTRFQLVMAEIAPYLKEFKMDEVRKPKHLYLLPHGLISLQLN